MRFARLLFVLVMAVAAAGCARQPVMHYADAPVAVGIDNVIYGPPPAAPVYRQAAVPQGRGLFMSFVTPRVPRTVAAPVAPVTMVAAAGSDVTPVAVTAYAAPARETAYKLDSGDRLRVVVFGQDGLSNSYLVDASGHIDMPLIGSVLARGATTDELSARLADKLRDGFIRDPHVAVEIEAYRPFFILGEVTAPGQYPYVANMTVETAVAIAGGFGPRAFRQTVTLNRLVNGQQIRMTVPITYPLRPGDTINVQERWF